MMFGGPGFVSGFVVGFGAGVGARAAANASFRYIRPLTRMVARAGIATVERGREAVAGVRENIEDITAEVRAEREQKWIGATTGGAGETTIIAQAGGETRSTSPYTSGNPTHPVSSTEGSAAKAAESELEATFEATKAHEDETEHKHLGSS